MNPEDIRIGLRVRVIGAPQRQGTIATEPRLIEDRWYVRVDFDDGARRNTRLGHLEPVPRIIHAVDELRAGRIQGVDSLRRNILHEKLHLLPGSAGVSPALKNDAGGTSALKNDAGGTSALKNDAGGTPALPAKEHKSWHSRGYLPHFDQPGLIQSLTFRLHDSVPMDVIEQWRHELKLTGNEAADDPQCVELRKRIEAFEDQGKGNCWLKIPEVAACVENALLHFDGDRYRLLAWCVMPNHVHAMIETKKGFPLGDVVHAWKSFTAKEANKILNRSGTFWMADYFDRYIRDARHFEAARNYIENNPVKAGLCKKPADWRWGHAGNAGVPPPGNAGILPALNNNMKEKKMGTDNAGETPALPGALPGYYSGAQGLAEDVRYYGQWMRDEAFKRIGHLYPTVKAIRKNDTYRHATADELSAPKS